MSAAAWRWIDDELAVLEQLALRRTRGQRSGPQGVQIDWNGRAVVNFGSNDYLGLAGHDLLASVRSALDDLGWGSGASPLVTGRGTWHAALEAALAQFEGTEAALVFPTGYAANLGTVAALAGRGDVIFSDAKNHASIIDGCRLSGARVQVFPHGRADYLEKYLAQASGFRRRLIVTDGLFSMDGDLAPLVELAACADRYEAMLVVDEAHATGVLGRQGRGTCEHLGIEARVTARVGTFSKALGSLGGFVVGPTAVIEWLANRARPYVFSTAAPEALAAAALAALRVVHDEPQRRDILRERSAALRAGLRNIGWPVSEWPGPIVSLVVGTPARAVNTSARLFEAGFLVPGIRPPTVPDGESLLRISLSSSHTAAHIEGLLAALARELPVG